MSRRDTIIIALLVNAGLLALLFMLAVNTDEEKINDSTSTQAVAEALPTPIVETVPVQIAASPSISDEMDNFLKEMPPEELSQPILVDEEGFVKLENEVIENKVQLLSESKPTEEQRFVEVTVKRGDALEKIARSNGTSVDAIKKANNLTSSKLTIGQVLKVPATKKNSTENTVVKSTTTEAKKDHTVASSNESAKTTAKGEPQYYTLKNGDSPWKVAKQFHVDFEELLFLNGLDEAKARNMKVGDKIRVK